MNRSAPRNARVPDSLVKEVVGKWEPGAWLTLDELAERLLETRPVESGPDGWIVDGIPLVKILNGARRRSWVRRNPEKTMWGRTPTGAQAAGQSD